MTAEISILNKHGIVLAADSAVTVSFGHGQAKTYNAVNKLFSLGNGHDIGIMIYGNAEFMDIPWEVIIKEFRREYKDYTFSKLKDCAEVFVQFLKDKRFKNELISNRMIREVIQALLQALLGISSNNVNKLQADNQETPVTYEQIFKIIFEIISDNISNNKDKILLRQIKKEKFISDFSEYCKEIINDNIYLPKEFLDELLVPFIELSYQIIVAKNVFDSTSGVVIAGYGSSEIFPSLVSYEISYLIENEIKMEMTNDSSVDLLNSDATIIPFAQSDMITTILTGIDPVMSEVVSNSIIGLENLTNDEKANIINNISQNQKQQFIDPILEVVRTLALPELANMAETLVNLTSFKRHISDSLETVGGPVDVLVISKGDGPIWINRKEYFDISKNIEYYNRKRR